MTNQENKHQQSLNQKTINLANLLIKKKRLEKKKEELQKKKEKHLLKIKQEEEAIKAESRRIADAEKKAERKKRGRGLVLLGVFLEDWIKHGLIANIIESGIVKDVDDFLNSLRPNFPREKDYIYVTEFIREILSTLPKSNGKS